MIKNLFRLLLVSLVMLSAANCSKSETPEPERPAPAITFGEAPAIPMEGVVDASVSVTITNSEGYDIEVVCDRTVVTKASYSGGRIIFSVSENTKSETVRGWIGVQCGKSYATLNITQSAGLSQEINILDDLEPIPASGIVQGSIEIEVLNAGDLAVSVSCDERVITSVSYRAPNIIYTAAANWTYDRPEGWIEVSCGNASERIVLTQLCSDYVPAIAARTGWYELPALHHEGDYICYAHDRLPSNNTLRNYSFCFAPEHYASLWVAYPLHDCYLGSGRNDSFDYDYDFAEYTSSLGLGGVEMQANVARSYYTEEGVQYDRGHQLPSADRNATTADNRTTFYATNMTPQHANINQKMWATLESCVREKWVCADTLYVVTGAVFADGHGYAYDNGGKDKDGKQVSLPTHYYKALLRTRSGSSGKSVADCTADELKCIAFWVEHDTSRSGSAVYYSDACSVEELERRTGMTFFVNVPNAPKSTYNASEWSGLTAK